MIQEWRTFNPALKNSCVRYCVEGMAVCKCIVPSRHRGTLNRTASPLARLVEEEKRWEAPDHPQGVLPKNWGETEQNRTVSCMVLKAKANDRNKNLALSLL
ncbi:uncharacterized protein TNCV_689331 [Trichonephila clavipes]|nr:uncharacterized protein TNCV_689331 [Trichonephila clavipes]